MLRTVRGFNDRNFPAFSGRILSMLRKEVSQLRMDTRPPYPCRSLRWVQRPPARVVTRDGEIIRLSSIIAVLKPFSSRYALSASRSASASSPVSVRILQNSSSSRKIRFSMEIIIGRLVSRNQDQNLVRQDRSFEIADNRLSSPDTATSWRGAI